MRTIQDNQTLEFPTTNGGGTTGVVMGNGGVHPHVHSYVGHPSLPTMAMGTSSGGTVYEIL